MELDVPGCRILVVVAGGEHRQAVAGRTPGAQVHVGRHGGREGRCRLGRGCRESLEEIAGSVVTKDGNLIADAPGEGFFTRIRGFGLLRILRGLDRQLFEAVPFVQNGFYGHFLLDGAGNERHRNGCPQQISFHGLLPLKWILSVIRVVHVGPLPGTGPSRLEETLVIGNEDGLRFWPQIRFPHHNRQVVSL